MTLTKDQVAWAESHVGEETVLTGAVQSWKENDDGTVTFTCSFVATPPPSAEQVAEVEAQRQADAAAAERARQEAEAAAAQAQHEAEQRAAAAEDERVRTLVRETVRDALADVAAPGPPGR